MVYKWYIRCVCAALPPNAACKHDDVIDQNALRGFSINRVIVLTVQHGWTRGALRLPDFPGVVCTDTLPRPLLTPSSIWLRVVSSSQLDDWLVIMQVWILFPLAARTLQGTALMCSRLSTAVGYCWSRAVPITRCCILLQCGLPRPRLRCKQLQVV